MFATKTRHALSGSIRNMQETLGCSKPYESVAMLYTVKSPTRKSIESDTARVAVLKHDGRASTSSNWKVSARSSSFTSLRALNQKSHTDPKGE